MKLFCYLPYLALATSFSALGAAPSVPVGDLGRVLCVGDSITHGKSSGSWRWELFKIFADNGIRLQEVGVQSGNYNGRGGIAPGTRYRGVAFANLHAAQFSEKAAEVAGRLSEPSRMGGTGIRHWLRLEGAAGSSWQLAEGETPDTLFLAIGTNDFVAEHSGEPGGLAAARNKVQVALIGRKRGGTWSGTGDMDAIVEAMREANPQARIIVIAVPTYSDAVGRWCHRAITTKDYEAVRAYNEALRHWGTARKLTAVVDMNAGFRDVTKEGAAVASMLVDQMHPNAQGNLIYAGNVAQQLGYAGRTAGLPRRPAMVFPRLPKAQVAEKVRMGRDSHFSLAAGGKLFFPAKAAGDGAAVEIDFCRSGYGNGAKGGWRGQSPLLVSLTTSSGGKGVLQIVEQGLMWNGGILYSADMSKLAEPVRLVWTDGSAADGIAGGFYLWVGDMLVGEALPACGGGAGKAGLCLEAGEVAVPALRLSYDPAAAWAPPSKFFTAAVE